MFAFACQALDRNAFPPLFIGFICLETQTVRIISRLTSAEFYCACCLLYWNSMLQSDSLVLGSRFSNATYNRHGSGNSCREMHEACDCTKAPLQTQEVSVCLSEVWSLPGSPRKMLEEELPRFCRAPSHTLTYTMSPAAWCFGSTGSSDTRHEINTEHNIHV